MRTSFDKSLGWVPSVLRELERIVPAPRAVFVRLHVLGLLVLRHRRDQVERGVMLIHLSVEFLGVVAHLLNLLESDASLFENLALCSLNERLHPLHVPTGQRELAVAVGLQAA